jgi:hypothetical protein
MSICSKSSFFIGTKKKPNGGKICRNGGKSENMKKIPILLFGFGEDSEKRNHNFY